jgi:hypothetical protein
MAWVESAPLWVVGLVIMAGLLLAHELGARLAHRTRADSEDETDEERGYLISSALALLGLLTAFTFAAAQDRWRLRQDLVIDEANAIGTTYLRFQMLEAPHRQALGQDMLLYTQARVAAGQAPTAAAEAAAAARAEALQPRIWRDLTVAVQARPLSTLNPPLLQTTNETFDLAASRRAADEVRVPLTVVRILAVSAFAGAAMIGFAAGRQLRQFGLFVGAMALLALAYMLILDLDRPASGSVRINQAPMQRALDSIRQAEAAARAAPPGG